MIGQTIVHYKLLDKLGAGGMGEIYKAEDTRLHRTVAVKVLSPAVAADTERRKRFLQEAQAASALNHPSIITVYDIVNEGDTQCIVMEYVAGKTLRDLIPLGGLPVPQALGYAVQMAGALSVAHAAGIIHRDLKPSNIMITPSGLVKILDFGLAKFLEPLQDESGEQPTVEQNQLTREGSIIGTVSYMSPEQAEGKRVDTRSDIFAFGSVLYEMLTGKRAFEGTSGISTLSAILRDEVRPIYETAPDVPPLLEQIVLRCLQKDPDARWQSMKQIEGALTTLQRQLDPGSTYGSPLSTTTLQFPPATAAAPPSMPAAPAPPASPAQAAPPPASSAQAPPPAPPPASKIPPPPAPPPPASVAPVAAMGAQPSEAPQSKASRPSATVARPATAPNSSKTLAVLLGLFGILLVGAAGAWWVTHRPPAPPPKLPEQAQVQNPPAAPPAPVAENPPPAVEQPPAAEQPPPQAKETPAKKPARKPPVSKKTPEQPATPPPAPASSPAAATPQAPPEEPKSQKPAAPPKPVVQTVLANVGDGLPFRMILTQDVPADVQEGVPLHFTMEEPFQVDGKTVIAKGAIVTGSVVSEAGKKKFLGIGGGPKSTYQLSKVAAVDGKQLSVRATSGHSGDGPVVRPFETPKGAKKKGFLAVQGTEYVGYIDGDQSVTVRK